MKTRLKIGFFTTDEEAEAESQRQLQDAFIEDYCNGRYLTYYILGSESTTRQQLLKEFKEEAENLIRHQSQEKWVTGIGYVLSSEISFKLRLKGLFNKLKKLRVYKTYIYDSDELPF